MLTYEKYAEYRDAKGLNDHKVSLLTGVPKATFSMWSADRYTPKLNTQLAIAKLLRIPPRELVSQQDIRDAQYREPKDEKGKG